MRYGETSKSILSRLLLRFSIDPSTRRFIKSNRAKWSANPSGKADGVVLFDQYKFQLALYSYSIAANVLARRLNASIETFNFAPGWINKWLPDRKYVAIYESFGAKPGLSFKGEGRYKAEARKFASDTMARLKTKWDVLNLTVNGVGIGREIYNSYLRLGKATVDLQDPALENVIAEAFVILQLSQEYLARKKVKAVVTSHWVYNTYGILVRAALAASIPVFALCSNTEVYVVELTSDNLCEVPYPELKKMFARLDESKKEDARRRARQVLEERLNGKIDKGIAYIATGGRSGLSGYGAKSAAPVLKNTGRPKIVVLLSCFLDSPLCFRSFLFPDFWEWITFLLDRAANTPFDWYVKPHPTALLANKPILEELRRKYPNVTFLDIKTSNRQLVEEGVAAMFTTYGTAGHEFAYMGVPVVHGGDNPHVAYDFNITPNSVEEFEKCIFEADRLKVRMDKAEIEEFFYMYYLYFFDTQDFVRSSVASSSTSWDEDPNSFNRFVALEGTVEAKTHENYFEKFFAKRFPAKTPLGKP